jgi:hypothetical protein
MNKRTMNATKLAGAIALVAALNNPAHAAPLGTVFTYQGQLQSGSAPANGTYDFEFTLYDAASGGNVVGATVTTNGVGISGGLFTVALDFGGSAFGGDARWLGVAVRTNGALLFNVLSPRQPVTASAYALFAPAAGLAASATTALTANAVGVNAVTAPGIAAGQVVKSLNGLRDTITLSPGANVTLTSAGQTLTLSSPTDWHIGGNAGTTPGVNFLGTVDNQPLELWVNNSPVLRLEPSGDGFNVIAGHSANSVTAGVVGATISGGGNTNGSAGGYTPNSIAANYASIGGGGGNQILSGGFNSVIGGGGGNQIGVAAYNSAIGGGFYNAVLAPYSTVPGGMDNLAAGSWSFAAGNHANANHDGTFVWADSQGTSFASTGTNQFLIRASGGLQVFDGLISVDSGGANTNGTLNPAPGLVFGGTGSGEGIASKRLNDGTGNTYGLDFFTDFQSRLSIDNNGDTRINDHTLFLRADSDDNHGLGWFGTGKLFAGVAVDGPVVFGYTGGALGTEQYGAETIALAWNATPAVGIGTAKPATTLDVNGTATIRGNLIVYGSVSNATAVTRYLPITVGDMLHNTTDATGDSGTGVQFPSGAMNGGSISFPLPPDYLPGTAFNLDLYMVPQTSGSGNMNFFVRWVGLVTGSDSGTGPGISGSGVPVGTSWNVYKQSFTLPAFPSSSLPEIVLLTIRRNTLTDTYPGTVSLTALRLSYQASR